MLKIHIKKKERKKLKVVLNKEENLIKQVLRKLKEIVRPYLNWLKVKQTNKSLCLKIRLVTNNLFKIKKL